MQDSKRDTDIKNRLLDSVGEGEGGMIWENRIETCIFSSVQFSRSVESNSATPWRAAWGWFPPQGYRHSANPPGSRLLTPASCHWPVWRVCFHFVRPLSLVCAAREMEHRGRHHQAAWGAGRGSGSLFSLSHFQPLVWGWTAWAPSCVTGSLGSAGPAHTPPSISNLFGNMETVLSALLPVLLLLSSLLFFFFCIFQTKTTKCVIQLACPEMSNLDWERAWYQILGGKRTTHTRRHNAILSFLLFLSLRRSVINGNMSLFSTKSFFSNLYK